MARHQIAMQLNALACLRGERLVLRQPQRSDVDAVYNYASDPAVTRFLAWPRHASPADSEAFVAKAMADWSGGESLVWLIEDEGEVIGAIGARISAVNAGIGYVLARSCWGQGYASEALQLLSDALTRLSPLKMLWAMCVTENIASARVLEKSGFHAIQTLARYFSPPNEGGAGPSDVVIYRRSLVRAPERVAVRRVRV